METKPKRRRSFAQLTRKERKILAMAGRIARQAERLQNGLPERYYRHGYLSIAEAAKQLDCGRKHVNELLENGRIRRVRIRGVMGLPFATTALSRRCSASWISCPSRTFARNGRGFLAVTLGT
jgi:excisionase family DNA binding protein